MSRRSLAIAFALIFGSAATPSLAQFPTSEPTEQPAPFVREAFASPYGHALIGELGRVLRAAADPVCLNSKGIAADQLEPRGEALLIKWGTRATETAVSYFDSEVYEKNFPASAELKELKKQPEIKRYLEIERPKRLAKILDFIFEQFDRYNMLRIKLASVSPIATGNDDLLRANPTEAAEDALDAFVAANKSAQIERFQELSEQAAIAMQDAIKQEQAILVGPSTFYGGIEVDLAELCIGSRRQAR
jgi:hypothetical protein